MIGSEESPEFDEPQAANVSQERLEAVNAGLVRMQQSAAQSVQAEDAALQQSAALAVSSDSVSVHQSILGMVEAEEFLSQKSAIGLVQAEKASVSGYTGSVTANNAEVHYGVTGLVVGREIHAENARTIFLVGQRVNGNLTTVLDARSALIAGLTGGLFAGLMLLLGRALFGRKSF